MSPATVTVSGAYFVPFVNGEGADLTWTPPRFPAGALPPVLGAAVAYIAASRIVDPVIPFTAYIGAISGVFADRAVVRVTAERSEMGPGDWTMPVNIYALTVAVSGDGKSPAFQPAIDLVRALEAERVAAVKAEVLADVVRLEDIERNIKDARKGTAAVELDLEKLHRAREELRERVKRTGRLSVADATPEATAGLMARNGGLLVVIDAEGTIVHHALGLYTNSPNLGLWLAAWSGERYIRDRVREDGASEIDVASARIGLGAAIQPGVLRALLNDARVIDRGFVARALCSWPTSSAGRRHLDEDPRPGDATVLTALADLVRSRWAKIKTDTVIDLDLAARSRFKEWHNELESTLPGLTDFEARAVPKLRASIARLAAVFHLLGPQPGAEVALETMEAAIAVGDYYLEVLAGVAERANLADAVEVLDWLWAHADELPVLKGTLIPVITVTDIRRRVGWHRQTGGADRTVAALEVLADHGWVKAAVAGRGFGAGRRGTPSPYVVVHPELAGLSATAEPPEPPAPTPPPTKRARPVDSIIKRPRSS
jgi:hypothetical protein